MFSKMKTMAGILASLGPLSLWRGVFVILPVLLLSACSTPGPVVSTPSGEIVQLHVMTMPVGLNLDGIPGVDGFSVKIYANNASNPKTVPIPRGQLEIIIWDGSLFGLGNIPPALHIWKWHAAEIQPFISKSGIGASYEFTLLWGADRPTQRLITVGARYTAPDGRVVTSRPSSVTVVDK